MKKYIIYKITNLVNDKIYIGSTRVKLSKRWGNHRFDAKRRTNHGTLYKAMNKYGLSNFVIEEIFNVFNCKELELCEKVFISIYQSNNPLYGYNIHDPIIGNSELLSIMNKECWKDPIKRDKRITSITKSSEYRAKPIVAVHVESGVVKHFKSIHEAIRDGFSASSICNSLKRKCLTGQKNIWFYFDDHTDDYYKNKSIELLGRFKQEFNKPLKSIDLSTNTEKIYKNIYEIKEDGFSVKVISRALRKGYKHSCGKIWTFDV